VSVERSDSEVESALEAFMTTAPRVAEALTVRLRVVGSACEPLLGETVNLSESGALVRTDAKLPPGTAVEVELTVKRDREPIVGTAVVVRSANAGSEQIAGFGLQFDGFAGDGDTRLAVCIRGLLAEVVG
jgi:hypothetical protein